MRAILWAVAVTASRPPERERMRRKKAPKAVLARTWVTAAMRKAWAARLALGLVRRDNTRLPDCLVAGHSDSQAVKCLTLCQGAISKPTAPASVSHVPAASPDTWESA